QYVRTFPAKPASIGNSTPAWTETPPETLTVPFADFPPSRIVDHIAPGTRRLEPPGVGVWTKDLYLSSRFNSLAKLQSGPLAIMSCGFDLIMPASFKRNA